MLSDQIAVERIYLAAEEVTGVPSTAIRSRHRGPLSVSIVRRAVCCLIRSQVGWKLEDLANELNRSQSHIKNILYNKNASETTISKQAEIENRIRAALRQ